MHQFEVHRIGPEIKLGDIDISFTNASLFMAISSIAILIIFNQAIKYHEEYGEDIESMPENIQNEILLIFDKIDEASNEVQSEKFELTKMMECPNFHEIRIKSRKLEKIDKRYDS